MIYLPPEIQRSIYLQPGEQPMAYSYVSACVGRTGHQFGAGYLVVTNLRCSFLVAYQDILFTTYREHLNMPYEQMTQVTHSGDHYGRYLVLSDFYFQMPNPEQFIPFIENLRKSRTLPPPPPPTAAAQQRALYCEGCGKALPDDGNFCPYCGRNKA